jgi:hypothetical protein
MALSDILFTEPSWLVVEIPAGTLGTPNDILTDKCMVSEIPPTISAPYDIFGGTIIKSGDC